MLTGESSIADDHVETTVDLRDLVKSGRNLIGLGDVYLEDEEPVLAILRGEGIEDLRLAKSGDGDVSLGEDGVDEFATEARGGACSGQESRDELGAPETESGLETHR